MNSFGFDNVGLSSFILAMFYFGILLGFLIGFLRFIIFTWTERKN
jgi:NhaP-type Na+/H+ or K+/H+ antiporter